MKAPDCPWERVTVDDIKAPTASAIAIGPFGSRMKSDTYTPTGVPVVRGNNITDTTELKGDFVFISPEFADELSGCKLEPGDLFFPHRGNIGEVGIITGNHGSRFMMSTSLMKLTPDPRKADPFFLFYFFRSPAGRHELLKNASQVGTPGIATPLASLRSLLVPLPPLAIQKAIVELLRTIDEKINVNRRMNATLEAMARALFQAWFVDFEPARARVAGAKSFPLMPQDVFEVLPRRLVESRLGLVPEGWPVVPLPDALDVNPSRYLIKDATVPYLDMANMPTQGHAAEYWIERPFGSGTRFQNGDTLVARITPCLENGKTAFVDFLADGQVGWGSTEYIVLKPRPPLPAAFAYYLARSENFRSFATQRMSGSSGRQRVPVDALRQFDMCLPPATLAQAFGDLVEPLMVLVRRHVEESRTLAETRDTLLPKLMSGEVRVRP